MLVSVIVHNLLHLDKAGRNSIHVLWLGLQNCYIEFSATLPRVHFGCEQRDQAGSTGHFYTHLAFLPRVSPAPHVSAPGTVSANLTPTDLPKLPFTCSLRRYCFYTRPYSVWHKKRERLSREGWRAVGAFCELKEFSGVSGADECHCYCLLHLNRLDGNSISGTVAYL